MTLKHMTTLFAILLTIGVNQASFAADDTSATSLKSHHHMMGHTSDDRISLGLSPQMKAHQLANMRSHVEAVQTIIGLMATGDFNTASETAHSQLGLTEEMQRMCGMFGNEDFKNLGLAFHKSGDALGDALETKDVDNSLSALHTTLGYCVQCHATFRQ